MRTKEHAMNTHVQTTRPNEALRGTQPRSWQHWRGLAILVAAYALIYGIFIGSAEVVAGLGHWGWLLVSTLVVATAVAVEVVVYQRPWRRALVELGLGRPRRRAVLVALLIGALLLACYPLIVAATGARFAFQGGLLGLIALFARNGIAEEALYRGFLFRRLRQGRGFGAANLILILLHSAAHAHLIFSFGAAVGIGAMLVAAATAVPYAYLYERGGNTILAPALLHFATDTILLLVSAEAMSVPGTQVGLLLWYVAISALPYLAFAFHKRFADPVATAGRVDA
jgi:membrane protease YdiL (CAAX protease family)